jgi:phage baseplate assembly protein W
MSERGLVIGEGKGISFSSTEDKLILENVKRILLTKRGERVKELEFGSDIREYLFLPEMRIDDILTEAKNSIERCEPRVKVLEAKLIYSQDEEFKIQITLKKVSDDKIISGEIGL